MKKLTIPVCLCSILVFLWGVLLMPLCMAAEPDTYTIKGKINSISFKDSKITVEGIDFKITNGTVIRRVDYNEYAGLNNYVNISVDDLTEGDEVSIEYVKNSENQLEATVIELMER